MAVGSTDGDRAERAAGGSLLRGDRMNYLLSNIQLRLRQIFSPIRQS